MCVNLMDEAARRGLRVDTGALARRLGVPVVGVTARRRASLEPLLRVVTKAADAPPTPVLPRYSPPVEKALSILLRRRSGLPERCVCPASGAAASGGRYASAGGAARAYRPRPFAGRSAYARMPGRRGRACRWGRGTRMCGGCDGRLSCAYRGGYRGGGGRHALRRPVRA